MTQIKAHIPKIRFKEFSWEWEEKKLWEVCTSFSWWTPLTSNKEYYNWNIPFIKSWEINKSKTEQFITDLWLNNSSAKLVNKWDLLYALYWATSWQVWISKINWAINQAVLCIKTKENTFFLYTILKNKKDSILEKFLQWWQWNLSADIVKSFKFLFPSLPEQQKIASFLSSVDEKIGKIKEKKKSLEDYKKWVMQKIFSQEMRFKDEDWKEFGEWEEKKLAEICEKQSSNISANTLETNTWNYKIYWATWFLKFIDFYQEEDDYISIVKDWAWVWRVLHCEWKSSVLGTLDKIKPKKWTNLYFLLSVLRNIDFTKYTIWSTIPHIYFKDYWKEKLLFPTLKEQEKIADFLSGIDKKIEKVNDALEKMEEFKKGLLQGIFV